MNPIELPKYYSKNVLHWWDVAMRRYAEHSITHAASPCGTLQRWSCQKGSDFAYRFDVIQSNKTLLICGDIGDLLIGRSRGTINWLLGSYRDLNYVAEKCEAGKIWEFCEQLARANVAARIAEMEACEFDADDLGFSTEEEYMDTMHNDLDDCEPASCMDFSCQFVHCVAAGVWLASKVLGDAK